MSNILQANGSVDHLALLHTLHKQSINAISRNKKIKISARVFTAHKLRF